MVIARFVLIGLLLSALVCSSAVAENTAPQHRTAAPSKPPASAAKTHKKTVASHQLKARHPNPPLGAQRRPTATRSAAKTRRVIKRKHPAPSETIKLLPAAAESGSATWMGGLQLVGMARPSTPTVHWDTDGRPLSAGGFVGYPRIAQSQRLIIWPFNPAYDISAFTAAENKLADPDIEWDDAEGPVINPPSGDDPPDPQPALSTNQFYAGLLEDRADSPLPKIEIGTVSWMTAAEVAAQRKGGPVEIADLNIAPANMAARILVCCRPMGATAPSQLELDVVFTTAPQTDKIQALDNPEARETGDVHGELLHAEVQPHGTSEFHFLLSLTQGDFDENFKLLISRPWVDIPIQFESGRRAVLTFATGKIGADAIYAAVHSNE
jgi:hypothetical protein